MATLHASEASKHKNFIASVLFAEIAGYADRPVFEQIQYTTQMRQLLERAALEADSRDLLIVDREESVVVLFPGEPTDCFRMAKQLLELLASGETYRDLPLHVGVNLGPVTMTKNELSVPQVNGAGVEDAARVARGGLLREVLISRAFYTVFARISKDYGSLQYREFLSDDFDQSFAIYQLARPSTALIKVPVSNPADIEALASTAGRGLRWRYAAVSVMLAIGAFALYQIQPSDALPTLQAPKAATTKAETPAKSEARPVEVADLAAAEPSPLPAIAGASSEHMTEPAPQPANLVVVEQIPGPANADTASEDATEPATPAAEIPVAVNFHHAIRSAAPPAAVRSRPAKQAAGAALAKSATVRLAIKPWGEVYIDGKKVGVTPPLHKIKIPPGKRRIVVRNGDFLPYRATLDIRPDSLLQISHRFDH